jgi:hypothetical protein
VTGKVVEYSIEERTVSWITEVWMWCRPLWKYMEDQMKGKTLHDLSGIIIAVLLAHLVHKNVYPGKGLSSIVTNILALNQTYKKFLFSKKRKQGIKPLEEIIPPEVVVLVFAEMTPKELLQCRLVSKSWRTWIDSPSIWKEKYRESFGLDPISALDDNDETQTGTILII